MRQKGFTLVELLIALAISSVFFVVFSTSLISGMKASRKAQSNFARYQPLRPFFLIFEKDLRNMVDLASAPFKGREASCSFPTFGSELGRIRYFLEGGKLVREEKGQKKVFMDHVKKFRMEYPYEDAKTSETVFLPFWLDDPYFGLPRAVKVSLEIDQKGERVFFARVISIPQGKIGHTSLGDVS